MNIRQTIYDLLIHILIDGQYANLTMRKQLNMYDAKEKHFASAFVYGVLRHYNQCIHWLRPFLTKKPRKKDEILLVMGTYQLKYMNVKAYVAIDQTVALAKPAMRGFINATLHQVDRCPVMPDYPNDQLDALVIETSLPKWVLSMWKSQYGLDKCIQFAKQSMQEAKVFCRWNTLAIDPTTVHDPLVEPIDDLSFLYHGNIMESAYYHLGQCVIQDANSTKIVEALDVQPNMNVLDCCAAPGSKTSQIAMMMQNSGHLTAIELHPHRVRLLDQTIQRLGITNTQTICGSLLDQSFDDASFDRILLDAPCSGLGVLARRAEMRFHVKSEALDDLQALQANMLDHIAPWLKPQGFLVYSTCTLNKKENEKQVAHFLSNHPEYTLINEVTIYATDIDCDQFYYALMQRM